MKNANDVYKLAESSFILRDVIYNALITKFVSLAEEGQLYCDQPLSGLRIEVGVEQEGSLKVREGVWSIPRPTLNENQKKILKNMLESEGFQVDNLDLGRVGWDVH